jgi:hypothetical protein
VAASAYSCGDVGHLADSHLSGWGEGVWVHFRRCSSLSIPCDWGERPRFLDWLSLPRLSVYSCRLRCSGMLSWWENKLVLSHGLISNCFGNLQPIGWQAAAASHSRCKSAGLATPSSSRYLSRASSSLTTWSGSQVLSPRAQQILNISLGPHL